MLATVSSCALVGIEAHPVQVEVDIASGIPHTQTVGLPDHAVRESKDRVRAALRNSGFAVPPRRITVNLAPAHLRKEGAAYDLPIALAMLAASNHPVRMHLGDLLVAGELALDGSVRAIRGALSIAAAARASGRRRVMVPIANAAEAALVDRVTVLGVGSLAEAVSVIVGERSPAPPPVIPEPSVATDDLDLADVRGQVHV